MALDPITITINGVKYVCTKKEPKQDPKYKVGDYARVIANKGGRPDADSYLGDTVQIIDVYEYGKYMRDGKPMQAYGIGELFVVFEDELEPAEAPKPDPNPNPFDIKHREQYYGIDCFGQICVGVTLDGCISVANACKDKKLMEQRALHEILNRLLWRASVRAGELNNPWDRYHDHWEIYCTCDGKFGVARSCYDKYCSAYFPTEESAQAAIDNIVKPFMAEHPDFVW